MGISRCAENARLERARPQARSIFCTVVASNRVLFESIQYFNAVVVSALCAVAESRQCSRNLY